MARNGRISRLLPPCLLVFLLLLLGITTQCCEARAMRQSKRNWLMNALFKLNFVREVEPTYLPPPASASTEDVDAVGLGAADSVNTPFCVNPPNAPPSSTPPFSSTAPSSTPSC